MRGKSHELTGRRRRVPTAALSKDSVQLVCENHAAERLVPGKVNNHRQVSGSKRRPPVSPRAGTRTSMSRRVEVPSRANLAPETRARRRLGSFFSPRRRMASMASPWIGIPPGGLRSSISGERVRVGAGRRETGMTTRLEDARRRKRSGERQQT